MWPCALLSVAFAKPSAAPVAASRLPRTRRSIRELSIGVSVKLTSIDTMIENAIVQPNWLT